jgi:UDP-N-acetyl-D-mannosaminuronate dehydrogenase
MQSNNKGVANREEPLSHGVVIVLGMGEVGQPLFQILSRTFDCVAVDIKPVDINQPCEVLHICYPFQVRDFVGITAAYIKKYDPRLTVIHSTLAPGTTRKIHETLPDRAIVYSPVRGKHARMEADMLRYKKFVAGFDPQSVEAAQTHFRQAGLQTGTFPTPDVAELSKLLETTYFGVLIGWAQEVERLAAQYDGTYDDVVSFIKEVDFLPSHIFPGVIGGHCVMPNIAILRQHLKSDFLEAVVNSNEAKTKMTMTEPKLEPTLND